MIRQNKFDWKSFFWALLGAGIFVFVVYAYALEMNYFGLYIDRWPLFRMALIGGTILGLIVGLLLTQDVLIGYDRMRIRFLMIFAGVLVMPLLVSLANRKLDTGQVYHKQVRITEITPYLDSGFGLMESDRNKIKYFKLEFVSEGVTNIVYPTSLPLGSEVGKTVSLPIHKGFLGYSWLDREGLKH